MIGERLGSYEITAKLGEGGMGVVWKAVDTRLGREAAIKLLPPGSLADPVARARFLREARAASALNHPNIVTIYGLDTAGGRDFLVMELISGVTLAGRLRQGPLPDPVLRAIARQIALALERAHSGGIVHRDLKPGNVMIAPGNQVKVLDFGLARFEENSQAAAAADPDGTLTQPLTRAGAAVGTPDYMSPEQAAGDSAGVASDIFSFGVVLYEMCSGARPFQAKSRTEVVRNVIANPHPPLPETVPADLRAVIDRCLEKRAEDRFSSMTAVLTALDSQAAGQTGIHEASTVVLSPAPRAGRSFRKLVPPLALFCAFLVAVALWRAGIPSWFRLGDPAGRPFESYRAARGLLNRYDRDLDKALADLEEVTKANPDYAPAHAALSEAYSRRFELTPDPKWTSLAREQSERAVELNPDLAAAHLAQGIAQAALKKPAEAEAAFRKALELDPRSARAWTGLAEIQYSRNQDADSEASYAKALETAKEDWIVHRSFGLYHYRRTRFEQALAAWNQALELAPDNVILLRLNGAALYALGRLDEAASAMQRALEIRPDSKLYTNLGTLRYFQGRYRQAAAAMEKAVAMGPNNYLAWGNLGDAYRLAPDPAKAHESYARAVQLVSKLLEADAGDADHRSSLAVYLARDGSAPAALDELKKLPGAAASRGSVQFKSAVVFELAGRREDALKALGAAIEAKYATIEIENEPDLASLRADVRYHRLLAKPATRAETPRR